MQVLNRLDVMMVKVSDKLYFGTYLDEGVNQLISIQRDSWGLRRSCTGCHFVYYVFRLSVPSHFADFL